jgi:hypothetical protein
MDRQLLDKIDKGWKSSRLLFFLSSKLNPDKVVKTANLVSDSDADNAKYLCEKIFERCDTIGEFLFSHYMTKNAEYVTVPDCDDYVRKSFAHYIKNVKEAGGSLVNDPFISAVLGEKNAKYLDNRVDSEIKNNEYDGMYPASVSKLAMIKGASESFIDEWKKLEPADKLATLLGLPPKTFQKKAEDEILQDLLTTVGKFSNILAFSLIGTKPQAEEK